MNEYDFGGRTASEFPHRRFWDMFQALHPREMALRARSSPWFWQRLAPDLGMVVTMYVAPQRDLVGVFFGRNARIGATDARWRPYQAEIEAALGGLRDDQRWSSGSLGSVLRVNVFAPENWPAMADWLVEEADRFEQAALKVLRAP